MLRKLGGVRSQGTVGGGKGDGGTILLYWMTYSTHSLTTLVNQRQGQPKVEDNIMWKPTVEIKEKQGSYMVLEKYF